MFFAPFPSHRPRRLRQSEAIRNLVQETRLSVNDLIYPLFVNEKPDCAEEIASMPGCYRHSIPSLLQTIDQAWQNGIQAIALFPVIDKHKKDNLASEAYNPEGLIPRAVRAIKQHFPRLCVITDVALDPFTKHGHDGITDEQERILNDETLEVLVKQALCQAQAGCDVLAPSDMMDGRIGAIRRALDANGFSDVLLLAYSAKFASAYYGPFRDALGSILAFGNKKTYQLNPANPMEAEKEIMLDQTEGADLLMVKPGLAYLDILLRAYQVSKLPLVVYSVSGEYAMIKAASEKGYLNEKDVVLENTLAFKRAGAKAIITYHALQIAHWLKEM